MIFRMISSSSFSIVSTKTTTANLSFGELAYLFCCLFILYFILQKLLIIELINKHKDNINLEKLGIVDNFINYLES